MGLAVEIEINKETSELEEITVRLRQDLERRLLELERIIEQTKRRHGYCPAMSHYMSQVGKLKKEARRLALLSKRIPQ